MSVENNGIVYGKNVESRINNFFDSLNHKVQNLTEAFAKLPRTSGTQEPWKTTVPAYLANPIFVNPALTIYHCIRTAEKVIKTVYHTLLAIATSLAVVFSGGQIKEINDFAKREWILAGANGYSIFVSAGFTILNVLCLLQGLKSIHKASENQAYLVKGQNTLNDEVRRVPDLLLGVKSP